MIHQPRVISTGNAPAENRGQTFRSDAGCPTACLHTHAADQETGASYFIGDAPLEATHRLWRHTACGDTPLVATPRLTSLYGPDPNRQGAFSQPDAGKAGRPSRILRARNRRHVADMSPGPIAARPRAATAFRSFLQAAPAATTVCRRKGRRDRPAAAVPDRRRQLQPISVAG